MWYNCQTREKVNRNNPILDVEQFNKDNKSVSNSDTEVETDSDEALSDIEEEDKLEYFMASDSKEDTESTGATGIPTPPDSPIL